MGVVECFVVAELFVSGCGGSEEATKPSCSGIACVYGCVQIKWCLWIHGKRGRQR